ncbi:MAG: MarR family transcriptional regulator, and catechol-resistance regulon repressor [Thermosediminibacterales bacterium]|nr:MarR family transcriptional regulator, and catechol-resistance regulon repressor [Thermosediminibacterales bacterium]
MGKLKSFIESYEWVEEISNKAVVELKKTSDMLEEIHREFFARFNISHAKFNLLVILYKGPKEGMILSEIGEQMLVTRANITGLIDRLEKQGMVSRVRDDLDRRKVMAVITEKGREFTDRIINKYRLWTGEIMSVLENEEKKQLIQTLKKLQYGLINLKYL